MITRSGWRAYASLWLLGSALAVATAVFADAPRAPGSNTGDGSTPFTGLAQAPEANLFAGALSTEIPILVPPARQNLTPKLALTYSSSGGPSPYGYGWDLPLGKIQRSTKHGAIRCGAEPPELVLQLPGATIECTLDASLRCLPATEESFLRIEYRPQTDSWEVWDKSGLHYYFGDEQMARQPVFPAPGCATFAWHLTHVEDPNRNFMHLAYAYDPDSHYRYPDALVYGGNAATALAPPFEVRFVWRASHTCAGGGSASRPCDDRVASSMGGFPVVLTRLLERIEVRYSGNVVRAYELQYDVDSSATSRPARRSFLSAVTLADGGGRTLARADGRPAATTFLYHQARALDVAFGAIQSAAKPVLERNDLVRWAPREGTERPAYRDVFDINGDAIPDLVDVTEACDADQSPSLPPSFADWDVYLGGPEGFATTPLKWSVLAPVLDRDSPCPPIRFSRSNAGGNVWSTSDTLDLTGDAIPDLVLTSTWSSAHPFWRVFPGITPASGGKWGFGDGIDWPAPYPEFRWSQSGLDYIGWNGSGDRRDVIDMNGDALPDLVDADPAPWRIWYNNGHGFNATSVTFDTGWALLRFTTDFGLQVAGVADINGDGMVDQIHAWERNGGANYSGRWLVRINHGQGVLSPEEWELPSSGCNQPGNRPWNGLRQSLADGKDIVRDFLDINGDGLPDVVEACNTSAANPHWTVWLNRGRGFSPSQHWGSPFSRIRQESESGEMTRDTFDIDGDGLVDYVDFAADSAKIRIAHNGTGAWCTSGDGSTCAASGATVAPNPHGGRPDLLVQMENGLGGTTYLEYRPSTAWDNSDVDGVPHLPWVQWTLTRIERDDGLCDVPGDVLCDASSGSHSVATDIEYAYGRYEPVSREFRGFRTVRETDALDGPRDTFFHQDAARRGKTEAVNRYDEGGLLVAEVSSWQCLALHPGCSADVSTCGLSACPLQLDPGQRMWVRLAQALRYDTSDHVIRKVSGLTNLTWDAYGNVTRSSRGGSATAAVDTITTFASYDDPTRYQVDRGVATEVIERADTPGAQRLQATWYAYDSRGNLTTTWKWLDQVVDASLPTGVPCPGGGGCATLEMRYDIYGNVIQAIDANGRSTWTTYDTQTHTYPATVRNALDQVIATTYDSACGTLRSKTSVYTPPADPAAQPVTTYEYDSFCRLMSVRRPDQTRPSVRYTHQLGSPGRATAVTTESLVSTTRTAARIDLFDALGRQLQTQRDAVVEGRRRVVVEAARLFDARGQASHAYAPFLNAGAGGRYARPPSGWGVTLLAYDGLGRLTWTRQPDGSQRLMEYDAAWQTRTYDACAVAATCSGGIVTEQRDAFGRTVLTEVQDGEQFGGATLRVYDGLGRLLKTTQAAAPGSWRAETAVQITYDSLGRRIRLSDPDSGAWRYGYDLTGNVLFVDDPAAHQHVSYCYDRLGRITDKFYGDGDPYVAQCGNRGQIAYTYDHYDHSTALHTEFEARTALGRLTRVDDASGHSMTFYDVHGRTKLVSMTVTPPGAPQTTAIVRYVHDAADHVTQMIYPDGERVKYSFDAVGQIRAVRGARPYVRKLTYDLLGRPRELLHGNAVRDVRTYAGSGGGHRLTVSETKRGLTAFSRLVYSRYNANGALEVLDDTGPTGSSDTLSRSAVMAYDGLGRLTSCATADSPSPQTYGYDTLGNMTHKDGMALTYQAQKPHTVAAINGSATGIVHDANGNRRAKPGFLYEFDADDRLVSINQDAVRFVYNHAGQRVAMAHDEQWTRYYGGVAEAGDGYLTKYYFAGPLLVASQRVANLELSAASVPAAVQLAGTAAGRGYLLQVLLRPDLAPLAAALVVGMIGAILALPGRRKPVVGIAIRRGPVLLLVLIWVVSTFPVPIVVRPAHGLVRGEVRHYHLDHLGSTQMVTDSRGQVLTHIRYAPYGGVLGHFDAHGNRLDAACGTAQSCREFTGYEREPISGLQYAGARFYDPELGMFLTHDPARQFANPYNYAGWNPTNVTDPNGEFIGEVLIAAVLAALISAAVNTVVAAAQGASLAQIGKAAAAGAVTGAVSVGIGVVVAGANVGLAAAAGTLPQNVTLQQAAQELGQVAARSATSSVVSNIAGQTAGALGAPDWAGTVSSIAAGYFTSMAYDQYFLYGGGEPQSIASNGSTEVSSKHMHRNLTHDAAMRAGFSDSEAEQIVAANLRQDGPPGLSIIQAVLSEDLAQNQSHFGTAASRAFTAAKQRAAGSAGSSFLESIGAASHYLQDQYALGHIFPGTHLLAGRPGMVLRGFIHQTVGGEVTFRKQSYEATLSLFQSMRNI